MNIEAANTEAGSDDYVTDQSIFVAPFSEGECSDDKLAIAQQAMTSRAFSKPSRVG